MVPKSQVTHCIPPLCLFGPLKPEQFLSLSVSIMTLTFGKSRLLWERHIHLDCLDGSSDLRVMMSCSWFIYQEARHLICPFGDSLITWLMVPPLWRFLSCKVIFLPFVINKYLLGRYLRPCEYPGSPQTFTHWLYHLSSLLIFILVLRKWAVAFADGETGVQSMVEMCPGAHVVE